METVRHSVGSKDHEQDGERKTAPQTDEKENEEGRSGGFANGSEERGKERGAAGRMPPQVGLTLRGGGGLVSQANVFDVNHYDSIP
jgi:hypothetical protein